MAIELFSENPLPPISPRISFSHDLSQSDIIPIEHLRQISSSSVDFDFPIPDTFTQESSSAADLFSDGKILPTQITQKTAPPKTKPPSQTEKSNETKRVISESDEKQSSKSFWRFKRSSSLNCGSGYARGLCSLPLLSRSNSTGSSVKRSKESLNQKQNSQRTLLLGSMKQSQSSSQKPPLKKSSGYYGNGVGINPVLNVPSGNLFGLGSIFNGNKDKNKKK